MSLLEKLGNISVLKRCWKSIIDKKADSIKSLSSGSDGVSLLDFEKDSEKMLERLSKDIKSGKFQFGNIKIISKSKDKTKKTYRFLSVPNVRDRIIHKAVLSIINDYIYPSINNGVSYCGVKEKFWEVEKLGENPIKKVFEKSFKHINEKYFYIFETDIVGFFDNLYKKRMYSEVIAELPDNSINKYIESIIYYTMDNPEEYKNKKYKIPSDELGIAQGSSLSPLFSNIYLKKFDDIMKKKYKTLYIRYVDDFVIFCKSEEEAKEIKEVVSSEMKKIGLDLAEEKTNIINLKKTEKFTFLGVTLISNKGIFPKKTRKDIKLKVRKYFIETVPKLKQITFSNGDVFTISDQINSYIDGWFNAYSFLHIGDWVEDINQQIIHFKKRNILDSDVRLLNKKNIKPIIDNKEFRELFKKEKPVN